MRRKGWLIGAWALATVAATLVAWAAVSQVTDEVSPHAALPFPSGLTVADAGRAPASAPTEPGESAEQEETGDQAGDAMTEAYTLVGGVVTVRYRGATTTLVGATPNSGFQVEINDAGPAEVDVRFRSERHESRLETRWRDGAPDPEQEERPR